MTSNSSFNVIFGGKTKLPIVSYASILGEISSLAMVLWGKAYASIFGEITELEIVALGMT